MSHRHCVNTYTDFSLNSKQMGKYGENRFKTSALMYYATQWLKTSVKILFTILDVLLRWKDSNEY